MTDLAAYVTAYLASIGSGSWSADSVTAALAAEQRAQSRVCTVPVLRSVLVSTTSGSSTVTAARGALNGYDVYGAITGVGIANDTTILAVDGCDVTLSAAATADGTDVSVTVDPDASDLAEALARRVATNLANRNLPLGVQTQVAEFGSTATRVGGSDREVTRLERPYRIVPAG